MVSADPAAGRPAAKTAMDVDGAAATPPPRWGSRRVPGGASVFQEMSVAAEAARATGQTIVDLSIGTSDLLPPPEAIAALKVFACLLIGVWCFVGWLFVVV
jgi:hypothetical protein